MRCLPASSTTDVGVAAICLPSTRSIAPAGCDSTESRPVVIASTVGLLAGDGASVALPACAVVGGGGALCCRRITMLRRDAGERGEGDREDRPLARAGAADLTAYGGTWTARHRVRELDRRRRLMCRQCGDEGLREA